MKIGILGGTFDPIHQGHLALARRARQQFELDRVLFIPAGVPPHKHRADLTPAPHRYRMVELAIAGDPGFEVSDVELSRPGPSYTVETLRALKKTGPDAEFYLILGADNLAEFPTWKEPGEIRKMAKILVARRENSRLPSGKDFEARAIDMPVLPIAATELRRLLNEGHALPDDMIPEAVTEYIVKHRLYLEK